MGSNRNIHAAFPAAVPEAVRGSGVQAEPVPRKIPEWLKLFLLGAFGGVLFGALIGIGLAGVI